MDDMNDVDVELLLLLVLFLIELIEFMYVCLFVDDLCCIVWTVARERFDLF